MLRSLMLTSPPVYAMPIGITLAIITASAVSAEERCKMSWEIPAADTKYTQQLALDVGDIPGHQVRVYELHRVYPNAKPNCEDVTIIEANQQLSRFDSLVVADQDCRDESGNVRRDGSDVAANVSVVRALEEAVDRPPIIAVCGRC
jgi:hypothetical protein